MTAFLKRCPGYSLSPLSKPKGLLHKNLRKVLRERLKKHK